MNIQPLRTLITASAIALATTTTVASIPNPVQSTGFFCGKSGGQPATIATRAEGNLPIIKWVSNSFSDSGFDAQRRCEQVSERFQQYHKTGKLKYLTTGIINRQAVICVATSRGGDCARELPNNGLLFTVKPGTDPRDTLKRLENLRAKASSTSSLNESAPSNRVEVENGDRLYIDMGEYLNSQPAESASPQSVESDASNQLF